MEKITTRIKKPSNIIEPFVLLTPEQHREQPVLFFGNDGHIEILGRTFENYEVKGFDEFVKYLARFRDLEVENENLKKELDGVYNHRAALIEYLTEKLEESKLEGTYGGQAGYVSIQERIYKEILDRVEGDTDENNII